jgi:hypothetical protein
MMPVRNPSGGQRGPESCGRRQRRLVAGAEAALRVNDVPDNEASAAFQPLSLSTVFEGLGPDSVRV